MMRPRAAPRGISPGLSATRLASRTLRILGVALRRKRKLHKPH